jgi:hypothetical protein
VHLPEPDTDPDLTLVIVTSPVGVPPALPLSDTVTEQLDGVPTDAEEGTQLTEVLVEYCAGLDRSTYTYAAPAPEFFPCAPTTTVEPEIATEPPK